MENNAAHSPSDLCVDIVLIQIDNYDEVLASIEEFKRPLLLALIDRKLNALAVSLNGIVRKYENDRYIAVISQEKTEELKLKKFEILQQIRDISMGNTIPVTLSIGIGTNGETLAESHEFARSALELALGRGGDQALIKDSDGYQFFGGIAREIGTNSRVRARVKAYALMDLINVSENVMVVGHKNMDLDCLGSAIGIYKMAALKSKCCKIVLSDQYCSVSYLYNRLKQETDYIENVFITPKEALCQVTEKTLLVAVDVHRPSLVDPTEILTEKRVKNIVVIDHHRRAQEFIVNAVLTYHEPYVSSTCELVTEMLQYTDVHFKPIEADALLAGITIDTKNFMAKTGARTFETAGYLRRVGADMVRVRQLFKTGIHEYKIKSQAVCDAEIFMENMAISVCDAVDDNISVISAKAADELLDIEGVNASFVICESNGKVLISARSLGDINVQLIMETMGGGGHQSVAGAQLKDISISEAKEKLKEALNQYICQTELP